MIILVDMDSTIADFESGFLEYFRNMHSSLPYIPLEQRNSFYLEGQYPEDIVYDILSTKGFFYGLKPIPGSIKAIGKLKELGNEIYFCTSPTKEYKYCVVEKIDWIQKHFGSEWIRRIIITYDKSIVHGDYLIDDNPDILSTSEPFWKHVIYDQPYNRHIKNKDRINWNNWHYVLGKQTERNEKKDSV
jgi:5'-nucleotidase